MILDSLRIEVHMRKDIPNWTWLLPSGEWTGPPPGWKERGGKWLVYGSLEEMKMLANKVAPLIRKVLCVSTAGRWTKRKPRRL